MARVQLALNVTGLDAAIDFYSKLFDTELADAPADDLQRKSAAWC